MLTTTAIRTYLLLLAMPSVYRFGFKWLRRSYRCKGGGALDKGGGIVPFHPPPSLEVEFEQRHLSEWDSCGGRQRH